MRSSLSIPIALAVCAFVLFIAIDSVSTGLVAGAITLAVALIVSAGLRMLLDAIARRSQNSN